MVSWGSPNGRPARSGEPDGHSARPTGLPVLLRGCTLRPRGPGAEDCDIELDEALVNPELLRGMATEFGVVLDGGQLATLAFGRRGFDPSPVFDWLEERCAGVPGFGIERCLVVGTFGAGAAGRARRPGCRGPGDRGPRPARQGGRPVRLGLRRGR
jgi:hypothetical protein